jgi:hypothetical protein
MQSFQGIYQQGVVRFSAAVPLAEGAEVTVVPKASPQPLECSPEALRDVYAILSERYDSGHTDTAARHNDHQP